MIQLLEPRLLGDIHDLVVLLGHFFDVVRLSVALDVCHPPLAGLLNESCVGLIECKGLVELIDLHGI